MKYFRPIQSGTNAGMTFKQYIGNNFKVPFLVALFAVVYFLIKFFVTKDFEAIYTLFVFLGLAVVWFLAMVIDWGIKRKRWED